MKTQKSKRIKVFVTLFITTALILATSFFKDTVEAESNTSLSETVKSIAIGSYGNPFSSNFIKKYCYWNVSIKNPIKGAKYSFTSSNNKIITVKTSGTTGYITGIAYGNATITCNQTLNGETTIIDKCKVTVEKANAYGSGYETYMSLGTNTVGSFTLSPLCDIRYRIPEATYTYDTNSKDLTIKDEKYTDKYMEKGDYGIRQTYTAKKTGTYDVTVMETYKNKTRKIGTFKAIVHNSEVVEQVNVNLDHYTIEWSLYKFPKSYMKYYFEGDGFDASKKTKDSIVYIKIDKDGIVYIYGVKEGTVKIKVYEGKTKESKKYIGTCTVTVKTADEN